jgi:hypothetical protein
VALLVTPDVIIMEMESEHSTETKKKKGMIFLSIVCLSIILSAYLPVPYCFYLPVSAFFSSFLALIIIGWSASIRNSDKGTFSFNPINQINASIESSLNKTETKILKISIALIVSSALSPLIYLLYETIIGL